MKSSQRFRQFAIFCGDILILYFSLFLTFLVRRGAVPAWSEWMVHVTYFSFVYLLWLFVFYVAGLYSLDLDFQGLAFGGRLLISMTVSVLLGALYFYLNLNAPIGPKTFLAIDAILAWLLIWLWRYSFARFTRRYVPAQMIAFVGFSPVVLELVRELRARPQHGYRVAAILDEESSEAELDGVEIFTDRESFVWNAVAQSVRIVVIANEYVLSEETRSALLGLMSLRTRFMRLPEFYELFFRRIPLGTINDFWFLENIDLQSKRSYEVLKRGIDIFLSLVGLTIGAPFCLLAAIAVGITSRGPIFFSQTRLGRSGAPFKIYKFRTMRTDRNDFAPTGTNDPRITAVGRFLRSSRLDELPQMLNILKGEMSFVGPRPERPELAAELEKEIPYYRQRLLVAPGVTGWDQVSGEYHSPSMADTYKKLQYDLFYVKNLSLMLDLSIFAKTILTVLLRKGR